MSMTAPILNSHLMYRSAVISEAVAQKLQALKYSPERICLLRAGLPVTYEEKDDLILEYPDGRRAVVEYKPLYEDDGVFVRYDFWVARELSPQMR